MAGPGQIYIYCEEGSKLLHHLISKDQLSKSYKFSSSKRLSRSDGDLYSVNNGCSCLPDSPLCLRSQTDSEDSGTRVSISSDDAECILKNQVRNDIFFSQILYMLKKRIGQIFWNSAITANGESNQIYFCV